MNNQVTFNIQGMTCASCVGRVERALKKVPGVKESTVNLSTEKANVIFDPEQVNPADLFSAVDAAGYTPLAQEVEIGVGGMTCASCVGRVERAIRKLPGVLEAGVNLATEKANVTYLPGSLTPATIAGAIERAGYTARQLTAEGEDLERVARLAEIADLRHKVTFAAVFTVPLFLVAMLKFTPGVGEAMLTLLSERGWMWVEFILATPGAVLRRAPFLSIRLGRN